MVRHGIYLGSVTESVPTVVAEVVVLCTVVYVVSGLI